MRRKPPKEGILHKVKDGEWVGSIAMSYGFADWENSVWLHSKNDQLRDQRENPRVLGEGDDLFIPPRQEKIESRSSDQRHRFKFKSPTEVLRIRVFGPNEKPLAEEKYELFIDCGPGGGVFRQQHEQTDHEGILTEKIPSTSKEGFLFLPRIDYKIALDLGYLTPMDLFDKKKLIRGAQERLQSIGFDPGPVDGIEGPLTRAAVEAFQQFCRENCDSGKPYIIDSGPVDGIFGKKTRKALLKFYGS